MLGELRRLGDRLVSMVTRGKVVAATAGPRTLLQVQVLDGEIFDQVELLHPFGYVALPSAGADVALLQANGSRDHKLALAGDATGAVAASGIQPGEAGIRIGARQIRIGIAAITLGADGEPQRMLVTDRFMALFNQHTHHGGPPPDQQMTAAHLTASTSAGGGS